MCSSITNSTSYGIAPETNGITNMTNCYYVGTGNMNDSSVSANNSESTKNWSYTSAKNTIGAQLDGYTLRWHIPDFTSEWLICDSESSGSLGEYYNECNGSLLYCDDSQATNYGDTGSCDINL